MRWYRIQPFPSTNMPKRITLTLADDVDLIARHVAARDNVSLGEAVSRLAREGYRAQAERSVTPSELKSRYSLLPMRDEIITLEYVRRMVNQLESDPH